LAKVGGRSADETVLPRPLGRLPGGGETGVEFMSRQVALPTASVAALFASLVGRMDATPNAGPQTVVLPSILAEGECVFIVIDSPGEEVATGVSWRSPSSEGIGLSW
jgi:hypothetical protein